MNQRDGRRFRTSRDVAVRGLKSQQYARTNQFEVHSRLDGLEEKFRILNNEPLADALRSRLDELAEVQDKWKPEYLSLLLQLSDRPLEKTRLEDLDQPLVQEAQPALTWAEILAEDPLTDEEIWDDVDFTGHSSDEDGYLTEDSVHEPTVSTQASSVLEEDLGAVAQSFVLPVDDEVLNELKDAQQQLRTGLRTRPRKDKQVHPGFIAVTELQAVREVLLMLLGVPTQLFFSRDSGLIQPNPAYSTTTIAASTFQETLHASAMLGSRVAALRRWLSERQTSALMQRCQAAVQQRLHSLTKEVSAIEARFISPLNNTVVSIVAVLTEVTALTKPLIRVWELLYSSSRQANRRPWTLLDLLFKEACAQQLVGDETMFRYINTLFFDCLDVYLRPVQLWMAEGEVQDKDCTFFITSAKEDVELGALWHDRYSVRKTATGASDAPSFVQRAANRIFATGKSIMFLHALGHSNPEIATPDRVSFDTSSIREQSSADGLMPFSELFYISLDDWIQRSQTSGSVALRNLMFSSCGLGKVLDALDHLYLSKNGSAFQIFANALFERMDRRTTHWDDRFILTELAQNAFGALPGVETDRLAVRFRTTLPSDNQTVSDLLSGIIVNYPLHWTLQNITREASAAACQSAFTFLLQVYRAQYVLNRQLPMRALDTRFLRSVEAVHHLALRQRLLWFVFALHAYIVEMSALCTSNLRHGLDRAADIDAMATTYTAFSVALADKLLLAENLKPIKESLIFLLDVCEDAAALWSITTQHFIPAISASSCPRGRADDGLEDTVDSEPGTPTKAHASAGPKRSVPELRADYDRNLSFAIAGLRGVSRAGGEGALSVLAERLEWGLRFAS
ncbi:hypothetical protein H2203_001687 [Taxawa tesnikishii (nom. ined.)]|nr:hypothetical protein H2203_001687 [Dothideales sp. JES 119]